MFMTAGTVLHFFRTVRNNVEHYFSCRGDSEIRVLMPMAAVGQRSE